MSIYIHTYIKMLDLHFELDDDHFQTEFQNYTEKVIKNLQKQYTVEYNQQVLNRKYKFELEPINRGSYNQIYKNATNKLLRKSTSPIEINSFEELLKEKNDIIKSFAQLLLANHYGITPQIYEFGIFVDKSQSKITIETFFVSDKFPYSLDEFVRTGSSPSLYKQLNLDKKETKLASAIYHACRKLCKVGLVFYDLKPSNMVITYTAKKSEFDVRFIDLDHNNFGCRFKRMIKGHLRKELHWSMRKNMVLETIASNLYNKEDRKMKRPKKEIRREAAAQTMNSSPEFKEGEQMDFSYLIYMLLYLNVFLMVVYKMDNIFKPILEKIFTHVDENTFNASLHGILYMNRDLVYLYIHYISFYVQSSTFWSALWRRSLRCNTIQYDTVQHHTITMETFREVVFKEVCNFFNKEIEKKRDLGLFGLLLDTDIIPDLHYCRQSPFYDENIISYFKQRTFLTRFITMMGEDDEIFKKKICIQTILPLIEPVQTKQRLVNELNQEKLKETEIPYRKITKKLREETEPLRARKRPERLSKKAAKEKIHHALKEINFPEKMTTKEWKKAMNILLPRASPEKKNIGTNISTNEQEKSMIPTTKIPNQRRSLRIKEQKKQKGAGIFSNLKDKWKSLKSFSFRKKRRSSRRESTRTT